MSDCNLEISPFTIPIQGIEIRNTSIIKERSPFTIPNQGSLRKYFYSNKNKRSTHPYLSPLSYTDHLASNRKTWASPWLGSQCQASRNVVLYATSPLASWSAAVWEETKHLSTNNNNTGTNIPNISSTGSDPGCILGRRCPPKPPEFNDLPELLLQGEDLYDLHAHRLLHCLERYMVAVSPHCARASAGLGFPSVCGSRQKPPPRCSSPCAWPARCRGGRSALVNHRSCQSWPPPRCSSPCAWPARWAGKLKTKYMHTYGPE